jgi:hypothetical protein
MKFITASRGLIDLLSESNCPDDEGREIKRDIRTPTLREAG